MPVVLYAIGDVHGCLHLYRNLENKIINDGAQFNGPKLIVLLGDFVDRGPNTAQLLDHLLRPAPKQFARIVLRGNHEEMFLSFLDNPAKKTEWLSHGGSETLMSYCFVQDQTPNCGQLDKKNRIRMANQVPATHKKFLTELPCGLHIGDYFFSHAGLDPKRPPGHQSAKELLWGDPRQVDDHDDQPVIVHGHIATKNPYTSDKRIGVDTGAFATGALTAVRLTNRRRKFLSSRSKQPIPGSSDGGTIASIEMSSTT